MSFSMSKEYQPKEDLSIYDGVSKTHLKFLESKNYEIDVSLGDETLHTKLDKEHFLGRGISSTVLKASTGEAVKIFFPCI